MKFKLPYILLFALLLACKSNKENDELTHNHNHSQEHGHHHNGNNSGHHHDGDEDEDDAISIDPEKASALGIETQVVEFEPFSEAIKVSGEITAPPSSRHSIIAHKSGIINLNSNIKIGTKLNAGSKLGSINGSSITGGDVAQSLQVDYDAAKRELERLTPLFEQGVISAKDYNVAKTSYEKAKLALGNRESSTVSNLSSPAGGTLLSLLVNNGDYVETGQIIGYIGDNTSLSLRADLPKRLHNKIDRITDAFILPDCDDCEGFSLSSANGKRLDGKPTTDNITGYLPVYFTFANNGRVEGGGFVDLFLLTDLKHEALTLPETAISEQQGQLFVYVQLDEDCYEKRPIKVGGFNGEKVEVTEGIKQGESVVTKGVTFVKLAETAGVAPEGHSHSH